MNADTVNAKYIGQQQIKYVLGNDIEGCFRSIKQSIDANKYEHPTATLTTNFINPAREANTYVQFVYNP